ncbi:ABC transporter ATP-binding protein [Anaerocolumna cellulosilytica]|uniref:ABC transporter ATP-binding protein n=1 Tax=Anaerocolumna cellulosilytica TaxID=433286 RepID=A0A6S6R7K7_9FIRM|nr:ABC-F type ribosomal protection protein [Anaerocolumna cellulosilytica]MBB5195484.1 ATPase subunit of ABC transporter with duplicated ATPase domains [Anaerocolumna cellulosilytica]BCJ96017.1 ABC transporter ATP-binding protein [Anaerocolumna cellulosilytica]
MIELGINNLKKYYGASKIFENISFELKTGERLGLIGQNGCGKTTLMKVLMGAEDYQEGEINIRKGAKMGYLNQVPVYDNDVKVIDVIRMAFDQVYELRYKMSTLEKQLESLQGAALTKALNDYSNYMQQYELEGGYELETKIGKITEGLKIIEAMKEMYFNQLSGGEKTRVILAKILLEEPQILLLDEPTNHLDLGAIAWLEEFLKEYKGSVIIISHDRYFLDSVVDKIVELSLSKASIYTGNYSYYVMEKERRVLEEYRNYLNQQKKIEQMENQIKRYRIWGEMRDSEKMFKRAKELERRLEKVDVLDKPVLDSRKVKFSAEMKNRSGKIVLKAENISKAFEEKKLFNDINFTLFYQDSACILGSNGCGKTTFLKIALGELLPDTGVIKLGAQVKIGYLPQQIQYLDEEQTILEYFAGLHNITYEAARGQLARVLFFKDDVNKKIKYLSGGEKSRLKLCSLTFEKVNFMILDEPTNHLDIDSREVLEEMLLEYEGTLLFVSHDRYFINKVADRMIEIKEQAMKIYQGDYNYYLEESLKEERENPKKEGVNGTQKGEKNCINKNVVIKQEQHKDENSKKKKRNEKKLELIEQAIVDLEVKLKDLEEVMEVHNSEAEYLKELFFEKERFKQELEKAYQQWEEIF